MTQLVEQQETARSLLERVQPGGAALAAEYPLVFDEAHPGKVVSISDGDTVRSACAILVRDFVVGDTTIRGGLIGSVSTAPETRGRGLGTQVLQKVEDELRAAGCVFSLLWADDSSFYLNRGYTPMGAEQDFLITPTVSEMFPLVPGTREARPEDAAGIHKAYSRHSVRLDRSESETASLLRCPGMRTLVVERDGEVVAYACLGRGRDLPDTIHEWAGDADDVLGLIRAHQEGQVATGSKDGVFLMAPPAEADLCYRLVTAGTVSRCGVLGLGKLLDGEAAAKLVQDRIGAEGRAVATVEANLPALQLVGPKNEDVLGHEAFLAVLFGAPETTEAVRGLLRRFGLETNKLPIQPFAWGLDSI